MKKTDKSSFSIIKLLFFIFSNYFLINAQCNINITTSVSHSNMCAGGQVTLTAFGASTYTWQSGPTVSSSLVVSPTAPTAYGVSGTNSLGCTSNTTQVVIVNSSPIINVIASQSLICVGGSSTLTASGSYFNYWNFGPTTATVIVSPTVNTVYTVSAGPGCNPTAVSINVFTQSLTVSNSTAICKGNYIFLNASGGTNYIWSNGGTGSSIFVNPSVSTLYTVSALTAYNNMLCNSTGSVNLTINPNPTITVNSGAICAGQSFTINPTGANTYTIQGGSAVVSPSINTTYTVIGKSTAGCVSPAFATSSLIVNPNPIITVNSGSICAGQNFIINPNGANTYTILGAVVSPTGNTSYTVAGTSTAVVSPSINNTYTVIGTNTLTGCVSQGFATSSLTVNECVGITNQTMGIGGVTIYPNPNNGEFIIESQLALDLLIINELGQTIKNIQLSSANNLQLKVSDLSNGIYFIVGKNNATNINQKIIVNK